MTTDQVSPLTTQYDVCHIPPHLTLQPHPILPSVSEAIWKCYVLPQ
jgi:hypothetical protein